MQADVESLSRWRLGRGLTVAQHQQQLASVSLCSEAEGLMSNIRGSALTPGRYDASPELIKQQFSYRVDMKRSHLTSFCPVNNERRQKNSLSVAPFVICPALEMSCIQRRRWKRLSFITAAARGRRISPVNAHWERLTAGIRFSV